MTTPLRVPVYGVADHLPRRRPVRPLRRLRVLRRRHLTPALLVTGLPLSAVGLASLAAGPGWFLPALGLLLPGLGLLALWGGRLRASGQLKDWVF